MAGSPKCPSIRDRLYTKTVVNKTSGCYEWTGCVQGNGYGRIRNKGRTEYVHRVAYSEFIGSIPDGNDVCHSCDNRRCWNPYHLFAGSRRDNMIDAKEKGRLSSGEAHSRAILGGGNCGKLRAEDVGKIRSRIASGDLLTEIAESYGVDPSTISCIKRGKTWRKINGKRSK